MELKELKKQVTIQQVVNTYLSPIQGSKYYKCPFHDDSNPSLSLDKRSNRFKCFACDAKGDVFDFVMNYRGVDLNEAKKEVASIAGITLKRQPPPKPRQEKFEFEYFDENKTYLYTKYETREGDRGQPIVLWKARSDNVSSRD